MKAFQLCLIHTCEKEKPAFWWERALPLRKSFSYLAYLANKKKISDGFIIISPWIFANKLEILNFFNFLLFTEKSYWDFFHKMRTKANAI